MTAPTVRLVPMPHVGARTAANHLNVGAPTLRLVVAETGGQISPTIRLVAVGGAQGEVNGSMLGTRPALLVSFAYLDNFLRTRTGYDYRDWVIDSGAFTAQASGKPVNLSAYIDRCRELLAVDPKLSEVYALDVIGDWKASRRNADLMRKAGIEAIPTYHHGEPLDALRGLARDFPKIALGGVARMHRQQKREWAVRCVAEVWPKKVHGFGFGAKELVMAAPFHSVDASSWEMGPCGYGRWNQFGKLCQRGGEQNLKGEVLHYLNLESLARVRWAKEMAELA